MMNLSRPGIVFPAFNTMNLLPSLGDAREILEAVIPGANWVAVSETLCMVTIGEHSIRLKAPHQGPIHGQWLTDDPQRPDKEYVTVVDQMDLDTDITTMGWLAYVGQGIHNSLISSLAARLDPRSLLLDLVPTLGSYFALTAFKLDEEPAWDISRCLLGIPVHNLPMGSSSKKEWGVAVHAVDDQPCLTLHARQEALATSLHCECLRPISVYDGTAQIPFPAWSECRTQMLESGLWWSDPSKFLAVGLHDYVANLIIRLIKAYQAHHKIPVDGFLGRETLRRLIFDNSTDARRNRIEKLTTENLFEEPT